MLTKIDVLNMLQGEGKSGGDMVTLSIDEAVSAVEHHGNIVTFLLERVMLGGDL